MQTYLVGGAVRDALMGLPVQDRDWVVVGATAQDLLDQGFVAVGRDFPVFLHPKTHEEYALARTERKTAPGYRGFVVHASPEVTLEEDLARRDLTINSIAASADSTGARGTFDLKNLVDPFGGQRDIADKVLRHTTAAFQEDPVRILRTARFAARFADFTVAPETRALMQAMVADGEADHLVAERVWQELAKGLMERKPSRMFDVLRDCGALARLLPELDTSTQALQRLDRAATQQASLAIRFALLDCAGNPNLHTRLRVPLECSDLARLLARERIALDNSSTLDATGLVQLLERCDAIRKPVRFAELLQACELAACDSPHPPTQRLSEALAAVQSVATNSIAASAQSVGATGPMIGELVRAARIQVVHNLLFPA
jgi:tRNA nucleotidyltransferase (CCA-adding enzyme)